MLCTCFFFQAEDGIRDLVRSRGLGDVYKRQVLGASRWRAFREITLPLLLPSLTAAGLLIFLFCFTSFGVILILGGPRFATLEVEIYRQAVNLFRLPMAAALALVQMVLTFAIMALYTRMQARNVVVLNFKPQQATQRRIRG